MNTAHITIVSPYRHANAKAGARVRAEKVAEQLVAMPGIRVTTLAPFPLADGARHIPFDLEGGFAGRIAKLGTLNVLLHRLHPTAVISESPLAPLAFGRFKVVHLIHDTKYVTEHGRRGSALARILYAMSVPISDYVMTVSRSEADNIDALYRCRPKLIVSYNGLSQAWLDRPATTAEPHYDIIYVSNFARHKGHLDLIEATKDRDYHIALVGTDFGEGEAIRAAAARSRCQIEFFSGLEEHDLVVLHDASRIMVFPSRLEGFGMPFLEGRSRGLPVIGHDIPVFRELASLVGGRIVDCADHGVLAAEIDQAVRRGQKDFPAAAALSQFRWSAIVEKLLRDIGIPRNAAEAPIPAPLERGNA